MFEAILPALSSLAGSGGSGGPSSAGGFPTYFTMNSPMSIAAQGGKASAAGGGGSSDLLTMALVAVAVSAFIVLIAK